MTLRHVNADVKRMLWRIFRVDDNIHYIAQIKGRDRGSSGNTRTASTAFATRLCVLSFWNRVRFTWGELT